MGFALDSNQAIIDYVHFRRLKPTESEQANPDKALYVDSVPVGLGPSALKQLFSCFGNIKLIDFNDSYTEDTLLTAPIENRSAIVVFSQKKALEAAFSYDSSIPQPQLDLDLPLGMERWKSIQSRQQPDLEQLEQTVEQFMALFDKSEQEVSLLKPFPTLTFS